MNLPKKLNLEMMQDRWASILNPFVNSPIIHGHLLANVSLSNGTTIINHKLGRQLIGWFLVGLSGAASIYDNQATNQTPNLTLSLTSNAAVTASIWVF